MYLENSNDKSPMETGINKKYRYDLETWSRLLDYFQQENVHFKNQLSFVIKNDKGNESLDKAEYFQNKFLNKDTVIVLLRQDIGELMRYMDKGVYNDGKLDTFMKKHKRLSEDVEKLVQEFKRIKAEFSDYVAIN